MLKVAVEEEGEDKMEVASLQNVQNNHKENMMEFPVEGFPVLALHQPHPEEVEVVAVEGVVEELTSGLNKSMLREWILTLIITIHCYTHWILTVKKMELQMYLFSMS